MVGPGRPSPRSAIHTAVVDRTHLMCRARYRSPCIRCVWCTIGGVYRATRTWPSFGPTTALGSAQPGSNTARCPPRVTVTYTQNVRLRGHSDRPRTTQSTVMWAKTTRSCHALGSSSANVRSASPP